MPARIFNSVFPAKAGNQGGVEELYTFVINPSAPGFPIKDFGNDTPYGTVICGDFQMPAKQLCHIPLYHIPSFVLSLIPYPFSLFFLCVRCGRCERTPGRKFPYNGRSFFNIFLRQGVNINRVSHAEEFLLV